MRRFLHLINDVGLGWMLAALAVTILLFATGYWMAAGDGHLAFTYESGATPGFGDSVYFSIVTISSLGYGDIRPSGWARALVSLEVIIGLAFLGVLVAKISSVKQDYILRRMYTDLTDDKLAKYAAELEERRFLFRTTAQLLMDGEMDPGLTTSFRRETPGATFYSSYRQLLHDVSELMNFESRNSALFGHVDDSRIESIYEAIRGVLRRMLVIWENDRDAACELVLCDNGPEIERICALADRLAMLGRRHSRNAGVLSVCEAILSLTERIRGELLPTI